jgi:hypothetical protein
MVWLAWAGVMRFNLSAHMVEHVAAEFGIDNSPA